MTAIHCVRFRDNISLTALYIASLEILIGAPIFNSFRIMSLNDLGIIWPNIESRHERLNQ